VNARLDTSGMTLTGKVKHWIARWRSPNDPGSWPCTPARAAQIHADLMCRTMLEDALFDEWWDGPGQDWPKVTKMMREVEGAPLKPFEMHADGWDKAFRDYCRERRPDVFK
jgi:hypothetical protein